MANCPVLSNLLAAEQCEENFGGLAAVVYVFEKKDVKTATLAEGSNNYTAFELSEGAKLYKFECKEQSQGMTNTSLGRRKGFKIQLDYVLESVNDESAKVARALNNLDLGYIIKDGKTSLIVYDPDHKFVYDNGGISFETGKSSEDDRVVNLSGSISPVKFPLYTVTEVAGGWDTLVTTS